MNGNLQAVNQTEQRYPVPDEVRRAYGLLCYTSRGDINDDDPLWDDNPDLDDVSIKDNVREPYIEVRYKSGVERIRAAVDNELAKAGVQGVRVEYVQRVRNT